MGSDQFKFLEMTIEDVENGIFIHGWTAAQNLLSNFY